VLEQLGVVVSVGQLDKMAAECSAGLRIGLLP
jgi:hypothetical protein